MAEWAGKVASKLGERLLPLLDSTLKQRRSINNNFQLFLQEHQDKTDEYISYQHELDIDFEVTPTFEQVSVSKITEEINLHIAILQAFEVFMRERIQSFNSFLSSCNKSKVANDSLSRSEGTLKSSFDCLFAFLNQEMQQARLQLLMDDTRRDLNEFILDAQRSLIEYQKEQNNAEKEVVYNERKIKKSKEQLEKCIEIKMKLEMNIQNEMNSLTMVDRSSERSPSPKFNNISREKTLQSKLKEICESISKCEEDMGDDVRSLINALSTRDKIACACRTAYQTLYLECKTTLSKTIRKIVNRERESLNGLDISLSKLEQQVNLIDIDCDVHDFISKNRSENDTLLLSTQALIMLDDLANNKYSVNKKVVSEVDNEQERLLQSLEITVTKLLNVIFYNNQDGEVAADSVSTKTDTSAYGDAVAMLSNIVKSEHGRSTFMTVLNQFRSKKVDITNGFDALGTILLITLDICMELQDIHSATLVMMLSQTFYKTISISNNDAILQSSSIFHGSSNEDLIGIQNRGSREYLKVMLCSHIIWHDSKFWEQVLWRQITDQLQSASPYDKAWHDLDRQSCSDVVKRVHNVIFSQLMGVTHSMLELGCAKYMIREFIYRVCTIYQLGEGKRQEVISFVFK